MTTSPPPPPAPTADSAAQIVARMGPGVRAAIDNAAAISPELGRMLVEFGFGDAYVAGNLDHRTRELATVAALAAMGGCEAPLRNHFGAADALGVDHGELLDVLVHLVPIIGFARVLVAVGVFAQWERELGSAAEAVR